MPLQAVPFTLFQTRNIETRNRSLRFDFNAMADFEQVTGMGLAKLMQTTAIFAATRALLWAGLKHQDRGLTLESIGLKMQEYQQADGDINDILKVCLEACVAQKAIPNLKLTEDEPAAPSADGGDAPNA